MSDLGAAQLGVSASSLLHFFPSSPSFQKSKLHFTCVSIDVCVVKLHRDSSDKKHRDKERDKLKHKDGSTDKHRDKHKEKRKEEKVVKRKKYLR